MSGKARGKKIIISVADNGIGFEKEELNHLFQEFHRGTDILKYEYEGVGLGLYLTKLIIEKNSGNIWVESEPNKGTTFFVSSPAL